MNEIGKTKLPNAREWWVQNDDGTIVFICGADPYGYHGLPLKYRLLCMGWPEGLQ